jgi:hypothetical protein
MKDCDSRSWIGREGLLSRDQFKERREQRITQVGFNYRNQQDSVTSYISFHKKNAYMYVGSNGDNHVHMQVFLREFSYTSESMDF